MQRYIANLIEPEHQKNELISIFHGFTITDTFSGKVYPDGVFPDALNQMTQEELDKNTVVYINGAPPPDGAFDEFAYPKIVWDPLLEELFWLCPGLMRLLNKGRCLCIHYQISDVLMEKQRRAWEEEERRNQA